MVTAIAVVVVVVIVVVETVMLTGAAKSLVWAGAVIDTLVEMLDIDVRFSCGAAFDCRPMAALDCAHVLQARMPSYHV